MGSPIWPKPQVASVCHQPDRAVLGHKSHVACPWAFPLLWLPLQLDQGSFKTLSGKSKNAYHVLYTRMIIAYKSELLGSHVHFHFVGNGSVRFPM